MSKTIKEELGCKTNGDLNQSVSQNFKITLDNEDNGDEVAFLENFKHLNVNRDEKKFKEYLQQAYKLMGTECVFGFKTDEDGNITEVCKSKR
ncbi:hypothetical protein [Veillonella sp. VA142]|uniref:hypothetical protein n=1 Tax=Veillonella sp. VA142 TaxID=741834 RepID=UPI000F8E6945|nr:hypothetical protein [Veillonella sp. VA142]